MSSDSQTTASRSRAPAPYVSTGRGGAGNMRPPSRSHDSDPHHTISGPDDYSPSQGREVPGQHSETFVSPTNQQHLLGSGRGGIGNAHSPSRGAAIETRNALREEAKYARERARGGIPVSHGRGGAGNFSFSRSRSRSEARKHRSRSPETPVDTSSEIAVAEVAGGSRGTTSKEEKPHGEGHHGSSSVSKITKLFRRGSRDTPRLSPELPDQ